MVELHPSKVAVVSSSLIARFGLAQVAQQVEHILGKDEVHGFEPRPGLYLWCWYGCSAVWDYRRMSKKLTLAVPIIIFQRP